MQKQLAAAEMTHVRCGWIVGLPWWVLWVPFTFYVASLGGIDLYSLRPGVWLWGSLVVGVLGMFATVAYVRWASRSSVPGRAERLRDDMAGASLRRPRAHVEEIAAFEKDGGPGR